MIIMKRRTKGLTEEAAEACEISFTKYKKMTLSIADRGYVM